MRPQQVGHPSLPLGINHYINMLIQQWNQEKCTQFHDGLLPRMHKVENKIYSHQQKCSPSLLPDIKFRCTIIG